MLSIYLPNPRSSVRDSITHGQHPNHQSNGPRPTIWSRDTPQRNPMLRPPIRRHRHPFPYLDAIHLPDASARPLTLAMEAKQAIQTRCMARRHRALHPSRHNHRNACQVPTEMGVCAHGCVEAGSQRQPERSKLQVTFFFPNQVID